MNFDIDDALSRLSPTASTARIPTGRSKLCCLPIDTQWDVFVDNLPEAVNAEGSEFKGQTTRLIARALADLDAEFAALYAAGAGRASRPSG